MRLGESALAAAAFFAVACGGARPPAPPPIVVISVDTLRADRLPPYGYRAVETPAIDALRRDSVLYENAYSHVPLTLPSHATLLTGLLPFEHGVRDNAGFRLEAAHPTIATLLSARGYATGAAVSSFVLRKDRGLARGFDFYDDAADPAEPDGRPGGDTADRLGAWLDRVGDRPAFALLHVFEPHAPYAPAEPYATRYAARPYDGEVAAADAVVGRFLERLRRLGIYDRAAILFLSDHGEGLNDHGEQEHGVFLYREAIRVPFLFKRPGSENAGSTVATPVGLADVFPTILDLAGATIPSGVRAASLLRAIPEKRRLYAETLYPRLRLGWSDLASLTDDRFQYIEAPRPELYDLLADPGERRDLSAGVPPAFRSMRLELATLERRPAAAGSATPEELRTLGSLGYLSVTSAAGAALPDPKDKVATLARYKELFDLYYAKSYARAIPAARAILEEDPRIVSVWRILAESLARDGRPAEAARALATGIAQVPAGEPEELSQAYDDLARHWAEAGTGRAPETERVLEQALARNRAGEGTIRALAGARLESGDVAGALGVLGPRSHSADPETLDLLGVALARAGRTAEARAALLRALAADPERPPTLLHLGNLSLREKDPGAARSWFERAIRGEPRSAAALTALGTAQAELGDDAGARKSWTDAIALDPKQYDALLNLGILAGRSGRTQEAEEALEKFAATAPRERYAERIAQARQLLAALRRSGDGLKPVPSGRSRKGE